MNLREILDALRRRWSVVVGATVAAIAVGVLLVVLAGTSYRASATVLLTQPDVSTPAAVGLLTAQKLQLLAADYSAVVESGRFVERALDQADLDHDGVSVTSETEKGTGVIELTLTDGSEDGARKKTAALVEALVDEVDDSSLGLPSGAGLAAIVLEDPEVSPATAAPAFTIFAALAAGLALGIMSALLLESS